MRGPYFFYNTVLVFFFFCIYFWSLYYESEKPIMPYVTNTGELRESETPLSPSWFWNIILGIWNFLYLLVYTLISPGYTKKDERNRRDDGRGGRGYGGPSGGGGGGGGPRQRPIGRLGGGGANAPECPPMAGGG